MPENQGSVLTDTELTAVSRIDDDIERFLNRLAIALPASTLDEILVKVVGQDLSLRTQGALTAALEFQAEVLKAIRSDRLRVSDLDAILSTMQIREARVEKVFDRAFFLFGLRRSGNHAVIAWLQGHFPEGSTLFLNSAEPSVFRTVGDAVQVDLDKYGKVVPSSDHKYLIVSYENCDPAAFPFAHNANIAKRSDGILLLRDYANTAASIARGVRERPAFSYRYRVRDFPALWCRYARLVIDQSLPYHTLLFNDWFKSCEYRSEFSRKLDLSPSDEGINRVSEFGGGSSFDGISHDGAARTMDLLQRWRRMYSDPIFQFLILADESALPLSDQLFGSTGLDRNSLLAQWRGTC